MVQTVGMIGLGIMGSAMSFNLMRAGFNGSAMTSCRNGAQNSRARAAPVREAQEKSRGAPRP